MTPDEAEIAVEVNAAAVVVSNHGGRVLDHTLELLMFFLKIAGREFWVRSPFLADGGVRTGSDVLKLSYFRRLMRF